MVIAEIIMLSRKLGDRNIEMHSKIWNKVSDENYEIRGKTLGIVGYGHIGTQLSVLAESFGMRILFYDVVKLMPLGTAVACTSLEELVSKSDFVTFHVPELDETKNMVNESLLKKFKIGSYLINASRGSVVDLDALKNSLDSGHIRGAAIDVYPLEPKKSKNAHFECSLSNCSNVILTPHIGGSTEEAQFMIGTEVATKLIDFIKTGSTMGSVNYPNIQLRNPIDIENGIRILYTHKNLPGTLKDYNIDSQICDSRGDLAYLMVDIHKDCYSKDSKKEEKSHDEFISELMNKISKLKNYSLVTRISPASFVVSKVETDQ